MRCASIDIGTNSVLLLVADRLPDGRFQAVRERAEITRLGRGVDKSRRLSPEGMEATLQVLSDFASEARSLGAEAIAVSATSAARKTAQARAVPRTGPTWSRTYAGRTPRGPQPAERTVTGQAVTEFLCARIDSDPGPATLRSPHQGARYRIAYSPTAMSASQPNLKNST